MALYELAQRKFLERAPSDFATLGIRERQDLQSTLFAQIDILGEDLKVIAQEYGNWEDARRRLDLLALDREGRIVVIELKRTADAGHADLQALRYAAMVSTLTFDDVVTAYTAMLATPDGAALPGSHEDPRGELLAFLGADAVGEGVTLRDDVRIILVGADFGRELTTTVLWLNNFERMDIRCVRLRPYNLDGRILIDVSQVIPLPEAADYQVRLKRKDIERERAAADRRDWTRYIVTAGGVDLPPTDKRNSIRVMIERLVAAGVDPAQVARALPDWALRRVDGDPRDEAEMAKAVAAATGTRPDRYFLRNPLRAGGQTWAISLAWGSNAEATLASLAEAFPGSGVTFRRAE
jgi:hypothetical protein